MSDLLAALCLVVVLEGLFLLVTPNAWKQAAAQLLNLAEPQLRRIGGVMVIAGLIFLYLVRSQ